MLTDFELWQNSECAILGITKEQHNKIVNAANKLDSVFGYGGSYYDIRFLIQKRFTIDNLSTISKEISLLMLKEIR